MELWTNEKIAKILLENKAITDDQYLDILDIHGNSGRKITKIVADKNITTHANINSILASNECTDLDSYVIDGSLLEKFKEEDVRKHVVIPLFIKESQIFVSMANPNDFEAQQMIRFATGLTQIRNITSIVDDVKMMIDKFFGRRSAILEAMKEVDARRKTKSTKSNLRYAASTMAAPVVKLVDDYILRALNEDASDIHFEPQEEGLFIRMRIDGKLQTIESLPSSLTGPMISRLKIMAKLKIDLRMVPQDGRFSKSLNDIDVDFRVSTFPGVFGESIVLRLLKRKMRIPISDLGFSTKLLKTFTKVINEEKGIFLVTGPTGCGKTTTLVSILHTIKDPSKKIVTLENPVEYQLDGTVQGQIHPQSGFNFSTGLRAILRHDPNIIMVAEVRDKETASIAFEAGLTGHFVLSTLHTNNTPSTIIRLLEMGVESYILASSLIGVLAQRLIRVICPECRESYVPSKQILKSIGVKEATKNLKFFRGKGCVNCRHTGFKGRTGIFELMLITKKMRQIIIQQNSTTELEIEARKQGMRTLREDGIRKVLQGITTLEEIMSITQDSSATE